MVKEPHRNLCLNKITLIKMLNFSNLIAFRVNGVSDKNNLDHIFYPIENRNIRIAEEELGFSLPQELAVFFEKVGYGFFW